MKNFKFAIILAIAPLLVSCTNIISNPDIQKLSDKASQLMSSGDYKGAISRLESVNDLNPNFPQTHYNLGIAYYKDEQFEKAIDSLKTAVNLDKNLADAYYTIALCYSSLAYKQIDEMEKPAKKETVNESENINISEKKPLSKTEAFSQIIGNLSNSKDYFTQYTAIITSDEDKQRISAEIENLDKDIKKYQEKISSSR